MTDEVTGPHSKIEAEGAWNNDNPEDKISRSVPVWYDLDKYVIRRVDGKVVGIAGYSDKGTYAIMGGMKSKEGSRSWKPMSEKRLELIGDKPKIAGFRAKTIDNEKWKEKNRQVYNFDIPPEDEMGIDPKLIEQFRNRYGEDFGIKKWFDILKFVPTGFDTLGKLKILLVDDYLAIFTGKYLDDYEKRRAIRYEAFTASSVRKLIKKVESGEIVAGKTYRMYIKDDAKDFSQVLFDYITNPDDNIKQTGMKLSGIKFEGSEAVKGAFVFHHIDDGHDFFSQYDPIPFKYTGQTKPNHREKMGSRRKRQGDKPENVFALNQRRSTRR